MLATNTDLESMQDWDISERYTIRPVFEDDEVRCLAVVIPMRPDLDFIEPFANLSELRDIIRRIDSGELPPKEPLA